MSGFLPLIPTSPTSPTLVRRPFRRGTEAKSSTWTSLMGSMDRGQQWLQVLKLLDLGSQLDLVLASRAISAGHTGDAWCSGQV